MITRRDKFGRPICIGVALLLPFLFIPIYALIKGHWIRGMIEAEAQRLHETSNIYSVLRSHNMDLTQPSVWQVAETIWEESNRHSLDPMLVVALIKVESRFRHRAISAKGARGLMQLRPFVAHALAEEAALERWEGAKTLDDPIINIKLGVFYLGSLRERFGDLETALTAYNWGPARVKKNAQKRSGLRSGYARKVLAIFRHYRRAADQYQKNRPEPGKVNI